MNGRPVGVGVDELEVLLAPVDGVQDRAVEIGRLAEYGFRNIR